VTARRAALRIATRGSALARIQAQAVADRLGGGAELVLVSTEGDRRQDVPIHAIGGRGVFAKEVQQAVLDGRADLAVHSAKDLTSESPPGLVIAAAPERADPRDALVGAALDAIPTGGVVASGSVRRRAQLAAARPDLGFAPLRGNIETRLARVAQHHAVVVALAALERLGRAAEAAEALDPSVVLPQVGQGVLAVECRADDAETRELLAAIDDLSVHRALDAERAFLAALGGGCDVPCGALAAVGPDGSIAIEAVIASLDGRIVLRTEAAGDDPVAVGERAAGDLLDGAGGREVLA
jgi:hydroxymethylbilane synthase